jgi:hypothetical protein
MLRCPRSLHHPPRRRCEEWPHVQSHAAFGVAVSIPAAAQRWPERDHQRTLIAGKNGIAPAGRWRPCGLFGWGASIEVECADKFKEGVGQALTVTFRPHSPPGLGRPSSCARLVLSTQLRPTLTPDFEPLHVSGRTGRARSAPPANRARSRNRIIFCEIFPAGDTFSL